MVVLFERELVAAAFKEVALDEDVLDLAGVGLEEEGAGGVGAVAVEAVVADDRLAVVPSKSRMVKASEWLPVVPGLPKPIMSVT